MALPSLWRSGRERGELASRDVWEPFASPFEADPGQVKASPAKGVLTVTVPKPPQVKATEKKIPITGGR